MSTEQSLEVETATTLSIEELLDCNFASAALGIEEIQIPKNASCDIEILRAYTNWRPTMPYFGKIIAILKYKGRIFQVYFHVWKEHQTASLANRISGVGESVLVRPGTCLSRQNPYGLWQKSGLVAYTGFQTG